jgi:outer membrane protein
MKLKQALLNFVLVFAACSLSLLAYHRYFAQKTGYIEIKKVFDKFQMKKELEEKYKQTAKAREKIIDSLSFSLQIISRQLTEQSKSKEGVNKELATRFEIKRDEFLKLKNRFGEDNAALSQKYDGQILEQMTQYVIEFGKKNNYDIILGADGNGTLMHAKENYNISDQVIEYINNKYKGAE